MNNETYLGDGLYASYDGWSFILRAPRKDGDHWVALEPSVLAEFLAYINRIKKANEKERSTTSS